MVFALEGVFSLVDQNATGRKISNWKRYIIGCLLLQFFMCLSLRNLLESRTESVLSVYILEPLMLCPRGSVNICWIVRQSLNTEIRRSLKLIWGIRAEIPRMFLRRFPVAQKIQHCHCSGLNHCRGAGSISGLKLPYATGMAEKKKKNVPMLKLWFSTGSNFASPRGHFGCHNLCWGEGGVLLLLSSRQGPEMLPGILCCPG